MIQDTFTFPSAHYFCLLLFDGYVLLERDIILIVDTVDRTMNLPLFYTTSSTVTMTTSRD